MRICRPSMGVSLVIAFLIASLPLRLPCQSPAHSKLPGNIKTSQWYTPDGEICRLVVVDCTGQMNRKVLVHRMVDLLVPKADRGAALPSTGGGMLGNCLDSHDEEYENVSISFNDNACYKNAAEVVWKNRECKFDDDLKEHDLCGNALDKLMRGWVDRADMLTRQAVALENQAAKQQDVMLKEPLLQQARDLRLQADGIKKFLDSLRPIKIPVAKPIKILK